MKSDAGTWVTRSRGGLPARSVMKGLLKVLKGPDKGKSIGVELRARVGSHEANDLQLSDGAVSRHHFELFATAKGPRLRDLGSTNGTFIKGVSVIEAAIAGGARIAVGDSELQFEALDDEAQVPASGAQRFGPLIGQSLAMRELYAELERIAPSDAPVLVLGETGSGKELVAEALVEASPRAAGPLVVVDCSALSPTLVESELFGHEKGAFTGATSAHAGAFERANGGTVFLDELGELPPALQPKLLRVLERREVQRLGGSGPVKVDVKVIAATHRAPEEDVNRGTFRADLFYRLSVFTVRVPPLRERLDDVELLARHFLAASGRTDETLTPEVIERFAAWKWPGNVRELRNAVERLSFGASPISPGPPRAEPQTAGATVDLETPYLAQKVALVATFERRYAEALMKWSGGNLAKAARRAKVDRMAVMKLMQRHQLL